MQYNTSQTVKQNFTKLLNLKALAPNIKPEHFNLATPAVVTPNAGNGNKNTSLVLSPAAGYGHSSETTTVFYNRVSLLNAVHNSQTAIVNSPSSHTAVMNALTAKGFETSTITALWPPHMPRPGQSMSYRITALAGHHLYTPGSIDVSVLNTGKNLVLPNTLKLFLGYPFNGNPLTDFRDHVTNTILDTNGGVSYFIDPTPLSKLIRFNAAGYLRIPKILTPNILSGDFTIEFWIVNRNNGRLAQPIICQWSDKKPASGFAVILNQTTCLFYFGPANAATHILTSGNGGWMGSGAYRHIAITREGNLFQMFVDGTPFSNFTSAARNDAGLDLDWMMGHSLNEDGEPVSVNNPTNPNVFNPSYLQADIRELAVWNYAKYSTNFVPVALI